MNTYKSNEEFFGFSTENKRQSLPEDVQLLLIYAISDKESVLNNLYKLTLNLPKNLQIEQLKKEIYKTNEELILLSEQNNFERIIFDIKKIESISMYSKFMNNDFLDCFNILNDTEYLQYLNYSESETDIKTLPKFDLITDYLALIAYYDYLMISLYLAEAGGEIPKPAPKTEYRFNTIFPDSVPDLYVKLHEKKLIIANKEHFVWAFGIGNDKPTDFKTIVWDGENTLLSYLINEVCQNNNKWKVAEMIFGVSGLAQTFKNCKGDPRGKELIDDIISEIG